MDRRSPRTLRYYRSTDGTISTSDTQVGTDAVSALAASATSAESIRLTAPSTEGTYYYGACVVAVAGEANTGNNCSSAVTVTVGDQPPPSSPDLVVGAPSVTDSSPAPGASFTLRATVRNQGSGSAAATTLRYYRSANPTIDTGDTQVGTDPVSALAASATSAESIRLTAPSTEGTYYYGACVVAVAGEANTGNNCSSAVTVTVGDQTAAQFTRPGGGGSLGHRQQPGARGFLHPEGDGPQPGYWIVGGHDAALLPLHEHDHLHQRYAGRHGPGERPGGVGHQPPSPSV